MAVEKGRGKEVEGEVETDERRFWEVKWSGRCIDHLDALMGYLAFSQGLARRIAVFWSSDSNLSKNRGFLSFKA